MKKIIFVFTAILLASIYSFAQSTPGITYQSVIRDNAGNILANQKVILRISILLDSLGAIEYQEVDTVITNQFGLATIVVGNGLPIIGSFSDINWAILPKYFKVELAMPGNDYVVMGVKEIKSVPHSLYSEKSRTTTHADTSDESEHAKKADTATVSLVSLTAYIADSSTNSNHATTADAALTATYADSSGKTNEANHAKTADVALTATFADSSRKSNYANTSGYASTAGTATYADSSGKSNYSNTSGTAVYADSSGKTNYSNTSGYAATAGTATYADSSGKSNYSNTSGFAANANHSTTSDTALVANCALTLCGMDSLKLSGLTDVDTAGIFTNDVLKWNGTKWYVANDIGGGMGDDWGLQSVQTDATLIGDGTAGNLLQISQQGATNGQTLKWDGSTWLPSDDLSGSQWQTNVYDTSIIYYKNGFVGIGKDAAMQMLDVSSHINTDSSYMINNKSILSVGTDTANENLFLGFNINRATTGLGNTFLGFEAGSMNNNGLYNVFLGRKAGTSNFNGISNTFLGNEAGSSNTSGNMNTFVGSSSGLNNFNGTGNVFIGGSSGQNNFSGSNNTCVGTLSGELLNSETNNTLIGANTSVSSGVYNSTAIGVNATVTQDYSIVLGAGEYVGIGTSSPSSALEIKNGDLFISDPSNLPASVSGIILLSPNGQCWRITVNNAGSMVTTSIACP